MGAAREGGWEEADGRKARPARFDRGGGRPPSRRFAQGQAVRSVAVNLAGSLRGWLKAHGHVSARQYDAGIPLRRDWETHSSGPRVTMKWEALPIDRTVRGAPVPGDATRAGIAAGGALRRGG